MKETSLIASRFKNLREALADKGLAQLGDTMINFAFSVAKTARTGYPTGARVDNQVLAQAARQSGLRDIMRSRLDRHDIADAAEAVLALAWLRDLISIEELVAMLADSQLDEIDSMARLISEVIRRLEKAAEP
jgi:hypothetical protein